MLIPRNTGSISSSNKCLTLRNKISLLHQGIIKPFRMSGKDVSRYASHQSHHLWNRTVPGGFISTRERQGFLVGSCIRKNESMVIWKRYLQQRADNSYLISILTSFTDHNPEQTAQEWGISLDKKGGFQNISCFVRFFFKASQLVNPA